MAQSTVKLQDVLATLNKIAAFSLAESWDNVGLLVGDPESPVTGILVALDPTDETMQEAVSRQANVLITHHPIIFKPLKAMRTDQPTGRLLSRALKENLAVVGCHTNLDLVGGGVNDVLADRLGLKGIRDLDPKEPMSGTEVSFGRIGSYPEPLSGEAFLNKVMDGLDTQALKVAGDLPEAINTVAVCGGSGSELAEKAWQNGCQVYITGEVKLSTARWAQMAGLCVIDAGHYPTENVIVPVLAEQIRQGLAESGHQVDVFATKTQKNPFTQVSRDKHIIHFNH